MKKNKILKDLKDYFKNTPKEQIKKDWEETKKFDKVSPTIDEFLQFQKQIKNEKQ